MNGDETAKKKKKHSVQPTKQTEFTKSRGAKSTGVFI